jgi:hypothetical protein
MGIMGSFLVSNFSLLAVVTNTPKNGCESKSRRAALERIVYQGWQDVRSTAKANN